MYWKFHPFFAWKAVTTNEFVICRYSVNNLWKQVSLYRLFKQFSLTVCEPGWSETIHVYCKNKIWILSPSLSQQPLPPWFFIHCLVFMHTQISPTFCFFCYSFPVLLSPFPFRLFQVLSWPFHNLSSPLRDQNLNFLLLKYYGDENFITKSDSLPFILLIKA